MHVQLFVGQGVRTKGFVVERANEDHFFEWNGAVLFAIAMDIGWC